MDDMKSKLQLLEEHYKSWRIKQQEETARIKQDFERRLAKLNEDYLASVKKIDCDFSAKKEALIKRYNEKGGCKRTESKQLLAIGKVIPQDVINSTADLEENIFQHHHSELQTTEEIPAPRCVTYDVKLVETVFHQNANVSTAPENFADLSIVCTGISIVRMNESTLWQQVCRKPHATVYEAARVGKECSVHGKWYENDAVGELKLCLLNYEIQNFVESKIFDPGGVWFITPGANMILTHIS
ncbi:uncharacterized protein LOC134223553 [Armigeres subalbatus]|uniref:uncharacterized protein LOC134223553 n=1 Tax=Armigeres subalbatus TaxID=124917 RepID=UPI002ED16A5D